MDENNKESEEVSFDLNAVMGWIKKHKTIVVYALLLLIVVLAFVSRTQNIPNLEGKYLVSPDDPYYFLRASNTIYETGGLPENDTLRYYPDGQSTKFENNFMAYLAGYTLRAVKMVAPTADMFDIAAWLGPSLLVIGLIGFFFLSKEVFEDNRVALIATGFLAFSSAIFFRTTAGFLEKEPLFLPLFCFAMWFFVKSYKQSKAGRRYMWAGAAGLMTALAGFSSGLFVFIYIYIGMFALAEVVLQKMDRKKFYGLAIWFLVSTVTLSLLTSKYGMLLQPMSLFAQMHFKIISFSLLIAAIYCFVPQPKSLNVIPKGIYTVIIGIIVAFVLGLVVFGFSGMNDVVTTLGEKVVNPAGTDRMSLSVSENQAPTFWSAGRGWWQTFGVSFVIPVINAPITIGLIFLFFFAGSIVLFYNEFKFSKYRWLLLAVFVLFMSSLIFESIGIQQLKWVQTLIGNQLLYSGLFVGVFTAFLFLERDRDEKLSKINSIYLFVIIWFGIATVAANGAVRLFFILAFSLVLIAAYFAVWCIDQLKSFEKYAWTQYIMYGVIILSIFLSFTLVYTTNGNMYPGLAYWYEATDWIQENTPENSVFTHWWDYGYLVQTMGGRATVGDPANFYAMRNYDIGGYLFNSKNNSEALKFLDKYADPDYLLICSEDVFKFYQIARLGSLSELYGPLTEGETLGRESYYSTYVLKSQNMITPNTIYETKDYPTMAVLEPASGPSQLLENFRVGSTYYDGENTYIAAYIVLIDKNGTTGPMLVQLFDALTRKSEIYPVSCGCKYKEGCFDINVSNGVPVCHLNYEGGVLNIPYKARNVLFTDLYLLDRDVPGFEQVYETPEVPLTMSAIHGHGTNVKIYKYNYTELENTPERWD